MLSASKLPPHFSGIFSPTQSRLLLLALRRGVPLLAPPPPPSDLRFLPDFSPLVLFSLPPPPTRLSPSSPSDLFHVDSREQFLPLLSHSVPPLAPFPSLPPGAPGHPSFSSYLGSPFSRGLIGSSRSAETCLPFFCLTFPFTCPLLAALLLPPTQFFF